MAMAEGPGGGLESLTKGPKNRRVLIYRYPRQSYDLSETSKILSLKNVIKILLIFRQCVHSCCKWVKPLRTPLYLNFSQAICVSYTYSPLPSAGSDIKFSD